MKSDFRSLTKTVRDDSWGPTETVTIRRYFGDAERRQVLSAASEYHQDAQGRTVIVGTLDRLHTTKRVLAIQSWTLLDEDEKSLPMTPDVIANLPPYVAEFIDRAIDEEWGNLGAPVSSKEEAERLAKEEKEETQTFRGSPPNAHGGEAPGAVLDVAKGAGLSGRSRAAPEKAHADA